MKNVFCINIEKETRENTYYRRVLFTTAYQQLVLMSVKPGEDIHLEIHPYIDQFIRIEQGNGKLYIGEKQNEVFELKDGISATIPARTWHRIINDSNTPLKLYTIYSPPNHPENKIDIDRPNETEEHLNILPTDQHFKQIQHKKKSNWKIF